HSREHVSTALESSGSVLYTTASSAVRLVGSCSAMETHSMKLSTHCCPNMKATQSLEVF
ncbi:unnamed protein product, partial [Staurois parvus]